MFQFYLHALDWYMQSKVSRIVRSFNENLLKVFEDTKKDVEESITELYREAAVANTAIVGMVNGKVSRLEAELYRQRHSYEARDILAGQRMNKMFQATWTEVKQLENTIKFATLNDPLEQQQQSGCAQVVITTPSTSKLLQASKLHLDAFCVIDGLNDFECGDGAVWCKELLDVLMERQRQAGGLFNVLFSTAGQSLVLPGYVGSRDRHMTVKRVKEVRRKGRGIPHQLGP